MIKWEGNMEEGSVRNGGDDPLIPFYVTRPSGDGRIYKWSIGARNSIRILLLGQFALILWLSIACIAGLLVAGNFIYDVGSDIVGLL